MHILLDVDVVLLQYSVVCLSVCLTEAAVRWNNEGIVCYLAPVA